MNLVLIFTLISFGVTLSETNEQGSKSEVSSGVPFFVNRDLGTFGSQEDCAQACKSRKGCLVWKYNRKSDECSIVKLKINDDKKFTFGISSCADTPPTTISGLESLLAEVRNISRVVEDLKELNENGLNSLNEKLTNVESQNEVLRSDFMEQTNLTMNGMNSLNEKLTYVESQNEVLQLDYKEQTNLTMEKIDATYNYMKSDFQAVNQKLRSLNEQTNLTKMEIKEKIDVKFDVAYNDHETLKNLSKDLENELKEHIIKTVICKLGYSKDPTTGNCYKALNDKGRIWNEAKSECEAQGAELASIRSRQEWQFVIDLCQANATNTVWLGGSAVEGTWVWTDGSAVTWNYWYPNRPSGSTLNNCMLADQGASWRWNNIPCSHSYYAVCKIPV